jgi:Cdc6-like AAA superfamily ATPase
MNEEKTHFSMTSLPEFKQTWADSISRPWINPKLVGSADVAVASLTSLLKQSVNLQDDGRSGECISALLIGPSGVGKSFVIKSSIESLRESGIQVIPITLHGSICSDDKSSMRQIFSQFQKYLIGGSTLETLERINFKTGTLSEWCERLCSLLQECTRSDHMVVITLEDFDQFCHTKSKQSLLYNLFDLMHVKDTRFVVVGATSRPDASEMLEKRIKSRFQLRKIVMTPPESLMDMVEIVHAALCRKGGVAVNVPKPKLYSQKSKTQSSIKEIIQETLNSKSLIQNWSLYRDLGFTVRDFVTAATSSLLQIESESQIEDALMRCMHGFAQTSIGDVGFEKSILSSLSLRDHIVLIGLLKLHMYRKRPKCFAHILKEIGCFEKRNANASICKHSKRAYWHSFMGLVRLGLIELIEYQGISAAVAPPPMFARCRLTIATSYAALFRNKDILDKGLLQSLPEGIKVWANESKEIHEAD